MAPFTDIVYVESYFGSNECFILLGMTPFLSAVQRGRITRKAA